jgi:hypothetical protein
MSKPEQQREDGQRDDPRAPWERPTVRSLGNVKDLVRGATKSGPNVDSDPQQTKKLGVG